jgi:hypothetical protein
MADEVLLDADALGAAAQAVGSTEIATLAVTTYLNTLADKLDGTIEFRELGPMEFPDPEPQL